MPAEAPLNRDDLDELSDSAFEDDDPTAVAAQLVEVAAAGRLADPADVGYAYQLAAEIYERADDVSRALALADRCLAAYHEHRNRELERPRAYRAELLLRLGREDEAMAELAALRPLMTVNALAASYVAEALEGGGRPEIAVRWLSEALHELVPADDNPVAAQLAATRDRIRGELGPLDLPGEPGPLDDLGEATEAYHDWGLDEFGAVGGLDEQEPVLLVWPQVEYEQVDQRWPEVLEPTGAASWEEYRLRYQLLISGWERQGRPPLAQVTGNADEFAEFLVEQGADPVSANLVEFADAYCDYLLEQVGPTALPPGRDEPCWCGSGTSYAYCCLPLSAG